MLREIDPRDDHSLGRPLLPEPFDRDVDHSVDELREETGVGVVSFDLEAAGQELPEAPGRVARAQVPVLLVGLTQCVA
jgi:hypothetical protein